MEGVREKGRVQTSTTVREPTSSIKFINNKKLKKSFKISRLGQQHKPIHQAYQLQEERIKHLMNKLHTKQLGWHMALTNSDEQSAIGMNEPVYGHLLNRMVLKRGKIIKLSTYIQPKIIPQLAFVIKNDLKGPGVCSSQVLESTAVIPVLTIVDQGEHTCTSSVTEFIAENLYLSKVIVGGKAKSPKCINLGLTGFVVEKNGVVEATATGAASMGHPALAVAWLINKLVEKGHAVQQGEVILSGPLCQAISVSPGDVISLTTEKLGNIEIDFNE